MIRSIIIEDEHPAQELLSKILDEYCQDLNVVGITDSVEKGIELIDIQQPDVVFLDIHLTDGNAFELLDNTSFSSYKTIFITACKVYALDAFKYEAIDYILKPYGPEEVVNAVERVKSRNSNQKFFKDFERMLSKNQSSNNKISISGKEGIHRFDIEDILHVEADGAYSHIHLANGTKNFVCRSLKDLEGLLSFPNFFRAHSGHLINIDHIQSYLNEDGGYALLKNGSKVPVARRRKNEFLQLLL